MKVKPIGNIFIWNCRGSVVNRAVFESELKAKDFDPTHNDRKESRIIHRIIKNYVDRKTIIRPIGSTDKAWRFALLSEHPDKDVNIYNTKTENTITVYKQNYESYFKNKTSYASEFRQELKNCLNVLYGREVGYALVWIAINQLEGIRLKDNGGTYFINTSNLHKLKDLCYCLDEINEQHDEPVIDYSSIPLYNIPQHTESIKILVQSHFIYQIKQQEKFLDKKLSTNFFSRPQKRVIKKKKEFLEYIEDKTIHSEKLLNCHLPRLRKKTAEFRKKLARIDY